MLLIIAVRNIFRNKRRALMCAAAVCIAVFFAIFMQSGMQGSLNSIENVVQLFDTGMVNISSAEFEEQKEYYPVQYPIPLEFAEKINSIKGVSSVLPRITSYATLQDSNVKHALLWGIKTEDELASHHFNLTKRSDGIIAGRYPQTGANECAIGFRLAEKMELGIGDEVPLKTVSAQFSDKMWSPKIVGIFNFDYRKFDEDVLVVSFERLQRLLVMPDSTQQLFVYADKKTNTIELAAQIKNIADEGTVVKEWQDNYFVALMRQSSKVMFLVYLVFQIVASFLIINTVLMIIHERIKEIGMMGSLGMKRGEIVLVFFFEAVFLSVFGAFAGSLLGGISTFIVSLFPIDFNAMMEGAAKEMPMSGTLYVAFSPSIILQGFLIGVVVASLCTLIPSLKSAFVKPAEALGRG